MGKVLYGREIAQKIRDKVREDISSLGRNNRPPGLNVITAGRDEASLYYADLIKKAGGKEGINVLLHNIEKPETSDITGILRKLNIDTSVDGILIQLPLPDNIDKSLIFANLNPDKDTDGQSPLNLGRLASKQAGILPATARAVIKLLKENSIEIHSKKAVVVGRSTDVGLPTALMLLSENATVTVCHTKSMPLEVFTKTADILVISAGVPELITPAHVKEDAVVVDVGTNEVGGKMVGDVNFEEVLKIASVSPVMGGVGPLTLACLFENTCELYKKNIHSKRD